MWLSFIHKWRRINHSSDPSCRLSSSTIWHLLPLSLIHFNERQSCSFHSFKVPSSLHPLIWTKLWPTSFLSIFWPELWFFFYFHLFLLILLSTINNTVCKYMLSSSELCFHMGRTITKLRAPNSTPSTSHVNATLWCNRISCFIYLKKEFCKITFIRTKSTNFWHFSIKRSSFCNMRLQSISGMVKGSGNFGISC